MVMVKVGDRYVRSRPNRSNVNNAKRGKHLPHDEHGNFIGGPGRGKGTPNKISGEAKKMFALAFEGIGGLKRLIEEANKSPWDLYKLYAKLIPMQVQGKVDVDININGEEARKNLETAFLRVIAARRAGAEDPAVIVDGERLRDITPQLVLPRKTGTDTS